MTRILVVDDELALVELVRSYLEREQYEVLTAMDGQAALELARASHPDLVVLDVMLPILDGLEVCRQLRQFSDAYVIMLTARAEEIDKILGLTVGADDYLTKPFSPRELVARIKALLRRPRQTASTSHINSESSEETPAPLRWEDLEFPRFWRVEEEKCGKLSTGGFYGQISTDLHKRIQATSRSTL